MQKSHKPELNQASRKHSLEQIGFIQVHYALVLKDENFFNIIMFPVVLFVWGEGASWSCAFE